MRNRAKNLRIVNALSNDLPSLRDLMGKSIESLQVPFLSEAQIRASYEVMGLDTRLIEDGTYFIVFSGDNLAGCGGWSKRATLYGGDHSVNIVGGRNARLLDPTCEPARIRAMYTHPNYTRRGVGRLILQTCEQAARNAGFTRAEMMATLAGVPLYEACGYTKIEEIFDTTSDGTIVPLIRMGKRL